MSSPVLFVIVIAVLAAIVIFWLLRSRGNTTGRHIDTSVTALGAVTEAVEEVVDAVVEKVEQVAGGGGPLLPIGVPAAVGEPDDLRRLKGIGPKLAALLTQLGITRYDQIAAWGPEEVAKVDAHLGTFKGRIVRDNWVEQAGFLAAGDTAGFEAKFGKLDG